MGYVSKDIAIITEPSQITLAGNPNFVIFESKPGTKIHQELDITVTVPSGTPPVNIPVVTSLLIEDPEGTPHTFRGSSDPKEVAGAVFYVSDDNANTAENLRRALLSDSWISSHFEVVLPFEWEGGIPRNGSTLKMKGKGTSREFGMDIRLAGGAYTVTWENRKPANGDSISGEEATADIALDVYENPALFLGQDERPTSPDKLGRFIVTLEKTYSGSPVWFDLNPLFSRYAPSVLPSSVPGWFDPDTARRCRFIARIDGVDSFPFYQSNVLYALAGGMPLTEVPDLAGYVYNENHIRLLTNKPKTLYVRGQREYLNFLFMDPQRGVPDPQEFSVQVLYRAYTAGGEYLGAYYAHTCTRKDLSVINTCVLDMDTVLDMYPEVGTVCVSLSRSGAVVSNDLVYDVLPECLHALRQFSFVNRLGGWDSFNFDAGLTSNVKTDTETYDRTLTPWYAIGEGVEATYDAVIANTLTVEGAPVSDEVAAWLKEFAGSRVILDGMGRRVTVEEFTLNVLESTSNMQRPTLKYRLSE